MEVKLISWTNEPIKTAAKACAICYDSEPSSRLVKQCIASGHQSPIEHINFTFEVSGVSRACYDEKTEILTRNGWKFFKDLNDNEVVATLNNNGMVEWNEINEKISYLYSGMMHKYKNQSIDLYVTSNHNMFYRKQDAVFKRKDYTTFLTPSENIACNKIMFDKRFFFENNETEDFVKIPDYSYEKKNNCGGLTPKTIKGDRINKKTFLKFLAWYLSDGSTYYCDKEKKYVISISQKETEKNLQNNTIEDIKTIIREMGYAPCDDGNQIKFNNRPLGHFLKKLGKSYEKYIPYNIFEFFNQEYAKIFIDEYFRGDGTIDKNNCAKLYTTSPELRDQLYNLCFMAGYTAKYISRGKIDDKIFIKGNETTVNHLHYVINVSRGTRNSKPCLQINQHRQEKYVSQLPVYCVNVKNHIIFVRRNGIACWCGNCLAQLTRHRIASYSVQSQRYVSMKDAQFIYPPNTNGYLGNEYKKAFDNAAESYRALQDLGARNEDARAVLPNACPTKIIFTMNLRSIGHFMNERLCARSQQEIKTMALSMIGELKRNKDTMGLDDEEMEIILSLCVPKCESSKIKFCPEHKSCGRQKTAKEINAIISRGGEVNVCAGTDM